MLILTTSSTWPEKMCLPVAELVRFLGVLDFQPPQLGSERMTKADLVEEISKATGLNKKDTSIIVNEVINNICRALAEGDKVELRGFGSFKVKERRARQARNPRTGAGVFVPAKLVPYFKASNELKSRVNNSSAEPTF